MITNCPYHVCSAGHECDMNRGFCDHFQKCRLVNVQGPLARLKDLLFSEATLSSIRLWVTVSVQSDTVRSRQSRLAGAIFYFLANGSMLSFMCQFFPMIF